MAFLENPLNDKNLQAKLDFLKNIANENTPKEEEVLVVSKVPDSRFDDIYRKNKNDLVIFAKKNFSQNDQEAEDAVQDAFIKLLKNIDNITPGKEAAWLRTVVANVLKRNYAIKVNRLRILAEAVTPAQRRSANKELITASADQVISKEEAYVDSQNLEKLKNSIELLPPRFKEIVKLSFFDGMSHGEIAEKLGIGASTSRANLTKAIVKLRKIYNHM